MQNHLSPLDPLNLCLHPDVLLYKLLFLDIFELNVYGVVLLLLKPFQI